MKKIALLDIDDTVANLRDSLMHALNGYTGKDIHWNDWDCYDLGKIYDIAMPEVADCIQGNKLLENVELMDGSLEFIHLLKSKNYIVHFVTARAWHENGYNVTKEWLQSRNVPYDALNVTSHAVAKIDAVKYYYNKVDLAIDDCYSHIEDYKKSGIVKHALLFHHPWNKNQPYDKIINHISEAESYL